MAEPVYTRSEVEAALNTMWRAGWSKRHLEPGATLVAAHAQELARQAAREQLERMEPLPDDRSRIEAVANIMAVFQPGRGSEMPRVLLDFLLNPDPPD